MKVYIVFYDAYESGIAGVFLNKKDAIKMEESLKTPDLSTTREYEVIE